MVPTNKVLLHNNGEKKSQIKEEERGERGLRDRQTDRDEKEGKGGEVGRFLVISPTVW